MPNTLTPKLNILPPPQLRLWGELLDVPESFVLYGGTAIALHLGHRQSVDFDFFGSEAFDAETLLRTVPFLDGAEVLQRDDSTLTCRVDRGGPVKLSFFGVPRIGRVEDPLVTADIDLKVASLVDLAGMKANVVQLRSEAKDYLDIAALIDGGIHLPAALAAGQIIYGAPFNPQNVLKALCYFSDGDLPSLPDQTKQRLVDAVTAVDLNKLPSLAPVTPRKAGPGPRQ